MDFLSYLDNHYVVLDGGMGSLLQQNGLQSGEAPELWNISRPEIITDIHRQYFEAGSNVVFTNTFGVHPLKYSDKDISRLIGYAVENAFAAREQASDPDILKNTCCKKEMFVALDIGPSGRLLKPIGDMEFEDAVTCFSKCVREGVKNKVDLIVIETMNDSLETKAALLAAKENSGLPVMVMNAFESSGRLMTGAPVAAMAAMLEGMHADIVGMNCSLGAEKLLPVAEEYLKCTALPVAFKPNAGMPSLTGNGLNYDDTPEAFAMSIRKALELGVRAVGGCCGTTPSYIRETSGVVRNFESAAMPGTGCGKLSREKHGRTVVSSYTRAVDLSGKPVIIGERINPTGKPGLKAAILDGDMDYIRKEAVRQQENGAQILDINVGVPGIDEPDVLTEAVKAAAEVCDLPLQIDTSDPVALGRALRCYNGKALINSVNGTKESMDAVFPLAAKYGGVIIALTLDENGIPADAQKREEIAGRIIDEAARYGIGKQDLVFDPLTLPVSADKNAAYVTLSALENISKHYGVCTVLGVSNISYGLPQRDILNSTFLAMALERGLSAAIMDPFSIKMQDTYHAFCALKAHDAGCGEYIRFAGEKKKASYVSGMSEASSESGGRMCSIVQNTSDHAKTAVSADASDISDISDISGALNIQDISCSDSGNAAGKELSAAIIKGLSKEACVKARELLGSFAPLDIISHFVIPALGSTGEAFEQKKLYLPQLLLSAEAASSVLLLMKQSLLNHCETGCTETATVNASCSMPVVIATVKGDVHDIGKNIVRMLLESYGFDVHDLGKDVPPEKILEEVLKTHSPLAGLSTLMTTTVPALIETAALLNEKAPFCTVCAGGAVLTKEFVDSAQPDMVYANDAMETVRLALKLKEDFF